MAKPMPTESEFDTLLARFDGLGRRDRKAVLACLLPDDRVRVEAAMTARNDARAEEAERQRRAGRQFADYSPWLSHIVQQACRADDMSAATIKSMTSRALAEAHRAMRLGEEDKSQGPFRQFRTWLEGVVGPAGALRP